MIRRRIPAGLPAVPPTLLLSASIVFLLVFAGYGCKRTAHTSDPHLKKIDELLNAQLPPGTPRSRVDFFLNSRGYRIVYAPDKTTIVAVVRHIDTETLQPATARVTFHFNSNEKLISYDMQAAPDDPLQP
jgi:hypothetical protein